MGDLRDWRGQPDSEAADAVVDPRLGRLLLRGQPPASLEVSYAYGFPGELGGGPYGTADDYAAPPRDAVRVQVGRRAPEGTRRSRCVASIGDHDAVDRDRRQRHVPRKLGGDGPGGRRAAGRICTRGGPGARWRRARPYRRQGRLELSGLTFGDTHVEGTGELAVEQCTLAPREGLSLIAGGTVAVSLRYSITGGVGCARRRCDARIVDRRRLDRHHEVARPRAVDGARRRRRANLLAADCMFTGALGGERGLVRTSYSAGSSRLGAVHRTRRRAGRASSRPASATRLLPARPVAAHARSPPARRGPPRWARSTGSVSPSGFSRLPIVLQELLPAGVGASVITSPDHGGEMRGTRYGDFSRFVDASGRRYTGVLVQQGRVQLDADWNAQQAIRQRGFRVVLSDLLAGSWAPAAEPGFGLRRAVAVRFSGAERMILDESGRWRPARGRAHSRAVADLARRHRRARRLPRSRRQARLSAAGSRVGTLWCCRSRKLAPCRCGAAGRSRRAPVDPGASRGRDRPGHRRDLSRRPAGHARQPRRRRGSIRRSSYSADRSIRHDGGTGFVGLISGAPLWRGTARPRSSRRRPPTLRSNATGHCLAWTFDDGVGARLTDSVGGRTAGSGASSRRNGS